MYAYFKCDVSHISRCRIQKIFLTLVWNEFSSVQSISIVFLDLHQIEKLLQKNKVKFYLSVLFVETFEYIIIKCTNILSNIFLVLKKKKIFIEKQIHSTQSKILEAFFTHWNWLKFTKLIIVTGKAIAKKEKCLFNCDE